MTDQEREELLAKRAELQSELEVIERFNSLKAQVDRIGRIRGYGYNGPQSAIEMQISDIDKQLDYDSYLIGFTRSYVQGGIGHADIAEIFRRYLADRGVVVEKPE